MLQQPTSLNHVVETLARSVELVTATEQVPRCTCCSLTCLDCRYSTQHQQRQYDKLHDGASESHDSREVSSCSGGQLLEQRMMLPALQLPFYTMEIGNRIRFRWKRRDPPIRSSMRSSMLNAYDKPLGLAHDSWAKSYSTASTAATASFLSFPAPSVRIVLLAIQHTAAEFCLCDYGFHKIRFYVSIVYSILKFALLVLLVVCVVQPFLVQPFHSSGLQDIIRYCKINAMLSAVPCTLSLLYYRVCTNTCVFHCARNTVHDQ